MYVVYGCTSLSEVLSNSATSIVGSIVGGIGNGFNGARQVDNVSRNHILYRIRTNLSFETDYNFIIMRLLKTVLLIKNSLNYLELGYKNCDFYILMLHLLLEKR